MCRWFDPGLGHNYRAHMVKRILVGNWKCQGSADTIHKFLTSASRLSIPKQIRPILAPPLVYLDLVKKRLPAGYALASQTCDVHTQGAFTGSVSAEMLHDVGCTYVIIGHAERSEPLPVLERQMERALDAGLTPIFCLGEEEPKAWHSLVQTIGYLSSLSQTHEFYVAYEPIWAIGGTPPSNTYLLEATHYLREHLKRIKGLLYGGGVRPENLSALLSLNLFDGILIGKASFQEPIWAMTLAIMESCSQPSALQNCN